MNNSVGRECVGLFWWSGVLVGPRLWSFGSGSSFLSHYMSLLSTYSPLLLIKVILQCCISSLLLEVEQSIKKLPPLRPPVEQQKKRNLIAQISQVQINCRIWTPIIYGNHGNLQQSVQHNKNSWIIYRWYVKHGLPSIAYVASPLFDLTFVLKLPHSGR